MALILLLSLDPESTGRRGVQGRREEGAGGGTQCNVKQTDLVDLLLGHSNGFPSPRLAGLALAEVEGRNPIASIDAHGAREEKGGGGRKGRQESDATVVGLAAKGRRSSANASSSTQQQRIRRLSWWLLCLALQGSSGGNSTAGGFLLPRPSGDR